MKTDKFLLWINTLALIVISVIIVKTIERYTDSKAQVKYITNTVERVVYVTNTVHVPSYQTMIVVTNSIIPYYRSVITNYYMQTNKIEYQ